MRIPVVAMVLKFSRGFVCALAALALPLAVIAPSVAAANSQSAQTEHRSKHARAHTKAKPKSPHTTAKAKSTRKTAHHSATSKKSTHRTTHHTKTTAHRRITTRQRRLAEARRRRLARARRRYHHRKLTRRELARSRKLHKAFVASTQLRPMAQQLATLRSPAAYAGVTSYAHSHTGEAASAAWLALGHAYLLDHKYSQAVDALKMPPAKASPSTTTPRI